MLGRFAGQLDAWVLAEGVERTAELESLIRLRVPLAQGYLLGRPAEPWATLPGEPAATIRDRQTPQTFQDSVVGLTVDAPAVPGGDALAAAARWFEAVARAMAHPAADRFDPLVCVDDQGHYLGVLRIEQLVHRLLAGPRP
jgi:hypothetical protein